MTGTSVEEITRNRRAGRSQVLLPGTLEIRQMAGRQCFAVIVLLVFIAAFVGCLVPSMQGEKLRLRNAGAL